MAKTKRGGFSLIRDSSVVPALMFHSVGLESHPWAWSSLSESLATFEAKIASFRKRGFNAIFWNELYDHMAGRCTVPDNSILLTFDDGYLDNWVYVYPILRKYGMKGTIFVSPDFVDPRGGVRPNLHDVELGRCSKDDLVLTGFLSWDEMREMEKSGCMDIQSHAMTHTWYFVGPEIVDFHAPHEVTPYPWLFWNARPERKPYYLGEDQQEYVPWGSPIFKHGKSLVATRFFPEEEVIRRITDFVAAAGGRTFFDRPDWRKVLYGHASGILNGGATRGCYETEEERVARITYELKCSRTVIGEKLRKEVDFICWPGGSNDDLVQDVARKVGYKAWTLSSQSQLEKRNLPGEDPTVIKRIGSSNRIRVKGRICGTGGARYQLWRVFAHQGSGVHKAAVWATKLGAFVASVGGSR